MIIYVFFFPTYRTQGMRDTILIERELKNRAQGMTNLAQENTIFRKYVFPSRLDYDHLFTSLYSNRPKSTVGGGVSRPRDNRQNIYDD